MAKLNPVSYIKKSSEGEGDISSVRMRVMAIALILMVACCCCVAGDRWSIKAQMHGKTKQLSNQNNHHSIPLKHYGKTPAIAHFDVIDDNDHHYIPPKDFDKPDSGHYDATDDNHNHYTSNMDTYGKPGGLIKTHG